MSNWIVITALLATGCAVELEVEEVRMSYRGVEIKANPGKGRGAAKHGFAFDDLSALQSLVDSGAEISFIGAELHATSGVEDMSFVDKVQLSVATELLFGCDGTCDVKGRDVAMKAAHGKSATEYVSAGSLLMDFDIEGHLPGNRWTLDFDVVLHAQLAYALDPR